MIYAIGVGDRLVGVSHECDFPADATNKPVVSCPSIDLAGMTLAEIDRVISDRLRKGDSIYSIDERILRDLRPDLIATQDLCQVCAPSGNELAVALRALDATPEIVFMSPRSIEEIEQNILDLGAATGREQAARAIVSAGRTRLGLLAKRMRAVTARPRVFIAEWVDPIFCAGHWVPEMVELAGGVDALGRKGNNSMRIAWQDVVQWAPEILLVSPCGFHKDKALEQAPLLQSLPGWSSLPAARAERVYAVDADSYFARPGPRIVDGIELLAHLTHPEVFDWFGEPDAFSKVPLAAARRAPRYP